MKFTPLSLDGIILFEGPVFEDARGLLQETWQDSRFRDGGVAEEWVQDNLSHSKRAGTVRGLHWQEEPFAQAKLVRVIAGEIIDVVVDMRVMSATYGQSLSVELSGACNHALYVPIGFAHGFCTLQDDTIVTYKTSAYYNAASERCMHWASPELSINWPVNSANAVVSDKDAAAPMFGKLIQSNKP
jgi:dTDP-4-dehydrorhamnose 3,5-epimerase